MQMIQSTAHDYVIAIDIGTTSTKALLVNRHGAIIASHYTEYALHQPMIDRAEQDPQEIYSAVRSCIHHLTRKTMISTKQVICVSFSSAMHSILAIDHTFQPLTACMTWADQRSASMVKSLYKEGIGHYMYLRTGTPFQAMSPLTKIMWLREHDKVTYQKTFKYIGIKEFVFLQLFQQFVIDISLASATGMFNMEHLDWDDEALALAGIQRHQLSEIVPVTHAMRGLQIEDASFLGLDVNTPFIIGSSDGVLANLGSGAIIPESYAISIGTSAAIRSMVASPTIDPNGSLFCYALHENMWVVGGAINNGGIVLRWLRDQFATEFTYEARMQGKDPYDYFMEIIDQVPVGSDGLLFLPMLTGERAPYYHAHSRGMYFGIALHHQKNHMMRAAVEGMLIGISTIVDRLQKVTGPPKRILASGGFTRSSIGVQMLCDILGSNVTISESVESSALGAAWIGLYARGEVTHLHDAMTWSSMKRTFEFDAANHLIYEHLSDIHRSLYQHVQEDYKKIAWFQNQFIQKKLPS